MFANVYRNPTAKGEEEKAIHMITNLYEYYVRNPKLLPKGYLDTVERRGESKERAVCDYIAGMTDTYADQEVPGIFYSGILAKYKGNRERFVEYNIMRADYPSQKIGRISSFLLKRM